MKNIRPSGYNISQCLSNEYFFVADSGLFFKKFDYHAELHLV